MEEIMFNLLQRYSHVIIDSWYFVVKIKYQINFVLISKTFQLTAYLSEKHYEPLISWTYLYSEPDFLRASRETSRITKHIEWKWSVKRRLIISPVNNQYLRISCKHESIRADCVMWQNNSVSFSPFPLVGAHGPKKDML